MSDSDHEDQCINEQGRLTRRERQLWIIGALLVAASIALGAFGAHAVKQRVSAQALGWWETAADYHRAHGLAVLAIAALWPRVSERFQRQLYRVVGGFVWGTVLFSGSLYLMTLTDVKALGAITPIGGTLWLIAWVLLAFGLTREH